MENYFFHYPEEKNRYNLIQHLLSLSHAALLSYFNIDQDTFTFLTLINRKDRTLKQLLSEIKTTNPFELLAYDPRPSDLVSTFFLQFISQRPIANREDKLPFYLYTKNHVKVSKYLTKIKNHRSFMYLTLCGDIKLKQFSVISALEHIHPKLFYHAFNIISDKTLVTAMAIVRLDVRERVNFLSETLALLKDCRFCVTKILQKKYFYSGDLTMLELNKDCLRFMGVEEDEEFVCSWLRLLYIKDRAVCKRVMGQSEYHGQEFKMFQSLIRNESVSYVEDIANRYAAVKVGVCLKDINLFNRD